jgi:hypothetical protein
MFPFFLILRSSKLEQNLTGREWLIALLITVVIFGAAVLSGMWWIG